MVIILLVAIALLLAVIAWFMSAGTRQKMQDEQDTKSLHNAFYAAADALEKERGKDPKTPDEFREKFKEEHGHYPTQEDTDNSIMNMLSTGPIST